MHRITEDILPEITDRPRPGADDVASALLNLAIRHQTLSRDEARELVKWDLVTIAEYLALLLEQRGLLSADEVCEMLGGTDGLCH